MPWPIPLGILCAAIGSGFGHRHGFAALCNFAAGALIATGAIHLIGVY